MDGHSASLAPAMSSSERRPFVTCSPFALLVIVLFVAAWFGWRQARRLFHPAIDPDAAPRAVTARGDLAEDEKATIELATAKVTATQVKGSIPVPKP